MLFMVCSFATVLIVARWSERIGEKVKTAGTETEKQGRGNQFKNLPRIMREDG